MIHFTPLFWKSGTQTLLPTAADLWITCDDVIHPLLWEEGSGYIGR